MSGNKFRDDEIKAILHLSFIINNRKVDKFVQNFPKTQIWIAEENLLFSCLIIANSAKLGLDLVLSLAIIGKGLSVVLV